MRSQPVPYHKIYYRWGNKGDLHNYQCFSFLRSLKNNLFEFHCEIDEILTPENVEFWREFTYQVLDDSLFKESLDTNWIFTVNPSKFSNRILLLAYLTWARYPQEFPEILARTHEQHKGDWAETFINLQKNHKIKLNWKYNNGGHSIVDLGIYNNRKPISLERCKENLKTIKTSVHDYFSS